MKYDAFISYSHGADRSAATQLQRSLESFAKPLFCRRSMRIFRDETNLEATPDLWSRIAEALDACGFFVLLASPESAKSKWIRKEIAHYLKTDRAARLCVVLTSGKLPWTEPSALPGEDECAISSEVYQLFQASQQEPLVVELQRHRTDSGDLAIRSPVYQGDVATLAAAILNRDKDELYGEHINRQRRFRIAVAVTGCLLLGLAVFGVLQLRETNEQKQEVVKQKVETRGQRAEVEKQKGRVKTQEKINRQERSRKLAEQALRLARESGGGRRAIELGVESLLVRHEAGEPPLPIALQNLLIVLDRQDRIPRLEPRKNGGSSGVNTVKPLQFSHDSRWLYGIAFQDGLRRWEVRPDSDDMIRDRDDHKPLIPWEQCSVAGRGSAIFSAEGHCLVATNDKDKLARVWQFNEDGVPTAAQSIRLQATSAKLLCLSRTGRWLAIQEGKSVHLWEFRPDKPPKGPLVLPHQSPVNWAAFSNNERCLATVSEYFRERSRRANRVRLWRLGEAPEQYGPPLSDLHSIHQIAFSADDRWLAAGENLWYVDHEKRILQEAPIKIPRHEQRIDVLAFSDTTTLLNAGNELKVEPSSNGESTVRASARLWDLTTGDPIVLIGRDVDDESDPRVKRDVIGAAFSPDGRWLATSTLDTGSILVFPMKVDDWIKLGRRAAGLDSVHEK